MAATNAAVQPSDTTLLDAWRSGDRLAGDQLVARYYDAVHRLFELKAGFVADDLTQRTFLACAQRADAVREGGSFRAYLFGVARRQYLDHQRRAGRADAAFERFGAVEDPTTSVSRRIARRQEQQLVMQAMALLPDETLLALQLYYWEGMATAEIAEVLEIPQSTVTSRLARGRAKLLELIGRVARRPELRDAAAVELDAWARSIATLPLRADEPRR